MLSKDGDVTRSQNGYYCMRQICFIFSLYKGNVGLLLHVIETTLFTATGKQFKTKRDDTIPLNGYDANLDRQDGLEEAPLHDAVYIGVAIEYLKSG